MPALYQIRWLPDGRTQTFAGSRGNYYEFSQSDRLDLHSVPVWCHRCGKITHGEDLATVDQIDQQIRDLADPSSEPYRMTRHGVLDDLLGKGEEFLHQQLAELKRRRHWRENRKSPPKCIHCGATEIRPLPTGTPFKNPTANGEIQIDCVGLCSTEFNEWFFTPEGDRIPRDTRPTYWHHPQLDKPRTRARFMRWIRSLAKRGGSRDT